jgi:hypothetical protein
VIPAKSHRNPAKSGQIPANSGRLFFFFSSLFRASTHQRRANLAGDMASEKKVCRISSDSDEFVGFQPIFQIPASAGIIVHGYPESLLRTCWEKKLLLWAFWKKMPTLREIKTWGGGGGTL